MYLCTRAPCRYIRWCRCEQKKTIFFCCFWKNDGKNKKNYLAFSRKLRIKLFQRSHLHHRRCTIQMPKEWIGRGLVVSVGSLVRVFVSCPSAGWSGARFSYRKLRFWLLKILINDFSVSRNCDFRKYRRRASRNLFSDLRKAFVNLGNRKLWTVSNLWYEKRAPGRCTHTWRSGGLSYGVLTTEGPLITISKKKATCSRFKFFSSRSWMFWIWNFVFRHIYAIVWLLRD